MYCGFDFGTSNTVVTLIRDSGEPLYTHTDPTLIFMPEKQKGRQFLYVGEEARAEYIRHGMRGRFIQGVKTLLPDDRFTFTRIFGRPYKAEDLVAMVIRHFHKKLEQFCGREVHTAVFGRPVRFSAIQAQDSLAEDRIRQAALKSGFRQVHFLPEPVGAALRYAQTVHTEKTILVGDFGGGTSDFTILKVKTTGDDLRDTEILATHGIRVGGTDFNSAIMWNCLTPYFGRESVYESWGKMLPVPVHIYRTLCRWDQIAFLKTSDYREELRYFLQGASDPQAIGRLIRLIDDDLGYALFQAIEKSKIELSDGKLSILDFHEGGMNVDQELSRSDFIIYIADEIAALEQAVDEVLLAAGLAGEDISSVFLTGGSSMVPAIQKIFWRKFGKEKVFCDNEMFSSVSRGLALFALKQGLGNQD